MEESAAASRAQGHPTRPCAAALSHNCVHAVVNKVLSLCTVRAQFIVSRSPRSAARSSTPALSLGAALGAAGLLLAAVAALRRSRVQSAAAPGRTEDIAASML